MKPIYLKLPTQPSLQILHSNLILLPRPLRRHLPPPPTRRTIHHPQRRHKHVPQNLNHPITNNNIPPHNASIPINLDRRIRPKPHNIDPEVRTPTTTILIFFILSRHIQMRKRRRRDIHHGAIRAVHDVRVDSPVRHDVVLQETAEVGLAGWREQEGGGFGAEF